MAQVAEELDSFAVWIGEVRERESLSQEGMARVIGVTRNTIQRWEQGRTKPGLDELRKVGAVFPIPAEVMRVLFTDEMEARSA